MERNLSNIPKHMLMLQDSKTSSSTNSTGTNDSKSSSGKSHNKLSTLNRGTRCSSSASSSTDDTETREQRFGSLDLHPLPSVALTAMMNSVMRRNLFAQSTIHKKDQLRCSRDLLASYPENDQDAEFDNVGDTSHLEHGIDPQRVIDDFGNVGAKLQKNVNDMDESDQMISKELFLSSPSNAKLESEEKVDSGMLDHTQLQHSAIMTSISRFVCPIHSPNVSTQKLVNTLFQAGGELKRLAEESGFVKPAVPISPDKDNQFLSKNKQHQPQNSFDATTSNVIGWNPKFRTQRIGPYCLGPTLGRGNFSVVRIAKHVSLHINVAIKIMNKDLIGQKNLIKVSRELEAMKRCQHPHIIRLYHVIETESHIFMVTEFASKGELFDHISMSQAFVEKEARELFWQIVCAIEFCHNMGIVHRDLKAENLMLDSDFRIKVADFGFCNFFQTNQLLSTHCGSPQYAAPELFKGEPYDGPLADVWSLGVVLYILVCGSFPFPGESLGEIRSQVLRGLVRFPFYLSTSCEQVIRCMLQVDPTRRFRLKQIIAMNWMNESPNVDHYNDLRKTYQLKAKEHHFGELFQIQHPEHSQLYKSEFLNRREQNVDTGILKALSVEANLNPDQVRESTIYEKHNYFHAAYVMLENKIHKFYQNKLLRDYVNRQCFGDHVIKSNDANKADTENEPPSEYNNGSSNKSRFNFQRLISRKPSLTNWKSLLKPKHIKTEIALCVLKLDEDTVLANYGITTTNVNQSTSNTLRRHTLQNTTSPLINTGLLTTEKLDKTGDSNEKSLSTYCDLSTTNERASGTASTATPPMSTNSNLNKETTIPRVGGLAERPKFSRQITQPNIKRSGQLAQLTAHKAEQDIRTRLDWMPGTWKSIQSNMIEFGSKLSKPYLNSFKYLENDNLSSLELGQEASTTEMALDEPQDEMNTFTKDFLDAPDFDQKTVKMDVFNFESPSFINDDYHDDGDDDILAAIDKERSSAQQYTAMFSSQLPTTDHSIRSPLYSNEESKYNFDVNVIEDTCDAATQEVLGTLLPQLNLPENLPAMIHQPVACFTAKDPHLLAPPEYMTPQSSSFPRRSSDGAADLQPLHRPAPTLRGSYPEQANCRNQNYFEDLQNPNATENASTNPQFGQTTEPICHPKSNQTTAMLNARLTNFLQESCFRSLTGANRMMPNLTLTQNLTNQQHLPFSTFYGQKRRSSLGLWWKLTNPCRFKTNQQQQLVEQSDSDDLANCVWKMQLMEYRKRFSLPNAFGKEKLHCHCHHRDEADLINIIKAKLTELREFEQDSTKHEQFLPLKADDDEVCMSDVCDAIRPHHLYSQPFETANQSDLPEPSTFSVQESATDSHVIRSCDVADLKSELNKLKIEEPFCTVMRLTTPNEQNTPLSHQSVQSLCLDRTATCHTDILEALPLPTYLSDQAINATYHSNRSCGLKKSDDRLSLFHRRHRHHHLSHTVDERKFSLICSSLRSSLKRTRPKTRSSNVLSSGDTTGRLFQRTEELIGHNKQLRDVYSTLGSRHPHSDGDMMANLDTFNSTSISPRPFNQHRPIAPTLSNPTPQVSKDLLNASTVSLPIPFQRSDGLQFSSSLSLVSSLCTSAHSVNKEFTGSTRTVHSSSGPVYPWCPLRPTSKCAKWNHFATTPRRFAQIKFPKRYKLRFYKKWFSKLAHNANTLLNMTTGHYKEALSKQSGSAFNVTKPNVACSNMFGVKNVTQKDLLGFRRSRSHHYYRRHESPSTSDQRMCVMDRQLEAVPHCRDDASISNDDSNCEEEEEEEENEEDGDDEFVAPLQTQIGGLHRPLVHLLYPTHDASHHIQLMPLLQSAKHHNEYNATHDSSSPLTPLTIPPQQYHPVSELMHLEESESYLGPLDATPFYLNPLMDLNQSQSLPAAAAAASLILMRSSADDDEDLAVINQVNQRLAAGSYHVESATAIRSSGEMGVSGSSAIPSNANRKMDSLK